MKTIQKFGLSIAVIAWAILTLCCGLQCEKNVPEIEKLPPATQTGAGTFGCLIDGMSFMPKGTLFGGPTLQCEYQYLVDDTHNGYYFRISAYNYKSYSDGSHVIRLMADSLEFEQKKYLLTDKNVRGKLCGMFQIYNDGAKNEYSTNQISTGELNITKFDLPNQIVSGTFWFDAVNADGKKVEVREGRFDVHFTL